MLTIITKLSILDVCRDPGYTCENPWDVKEINCLKEMFSKINQKKRIHDWLLDNLHSLITTSKQMFTNVQNMKNFEGIGTRFYLNSLTLVNMLSLHHTFMLLSTIISFCNYLDEIVLNLNVFKVFKVLVKFLYQKFGIAVLG